MSAEPLLVYRDDGPLARALGRAGARLGELPSIVPMAAGLLPLAVTAAATRADAPTGLAAAAVAWLVLCGGVAAGRPNRRLIWATAPAVRAGEYGGLLWLAVLAGRHAAGAAFALLLVLAYHHYDLVYRLRFQHRPPPAWTSTLAGGWEGRLVVAAVLLATGGLATGYAVLAALLALLFVGESITGWRSFLRAGGPETDDEDDEGTLE